MAEEKKKNIFDKAVDLFTNRDEKAAAEEAAKKAADARAQASKESAQKIAAQQNAQRAAAEAKAKAEETEKRAQDMSKMRQERAADDAALAAKAAAAAPKFIAEHKVKAGETLSHIALKHYGKAIEDYWMVIYEANKAIIGSSPSVIKEGMVLKIPELPASLKK